MASILAVVVDPSNPGKLAISPVDAPVPSRGEALVRVAALSLNRGEVRRALSAEPGWRPGWDFAGTVEQSAADGTGPKAGARVVGLLSSGAWAELVTVGADRVAELPAEVTFAQASTLPIAGLTALHVVGLGGSLLGRRALVTGASGGVGHFAVQLVKLSGGTAVALVRQEPHAEFVRGAGADLVLIGEDASDAAPHGPFDLIADSVGGRTLATALESISVGGLCVNFGSSQPGLPAIDMHRFFLTGGARIYGFALSHELRKDRASRGLARLGALVAAGKVRPHIAVEDDWTKIGEVAQFLIDRRFVGKAVLRIGS